MGTPYRFYQIKSPSSTIIRWIALLLVCFFVWAYFATLTEVSRGQGKVVASSKEQVIQSLEGGVLQKLLVSEGEIVQAGQLLALLDPERAESTAEETKARLLAAQATVARLEAEVNNLPAPEFPEEVKEDPALVEAETALFKSRRDGYQQTLMGLQRSAGLIGREMNIKRPLIAKGAATQVEVLQLERQYADLQNKIIDHKNQYLVRAREELAKVKTEVEVQTQLLRGRSDIVSRTNLTSPVKGIVKDISVRTMGGVIPPNGEIMRIIPSDDRLLIETKISPQDIAYIHPQQKAQVKISSYDYSIYGGLEGKVELISPDTIQDEVKREQYFYRVYIRTDKDFLKTPDGKEHKITPGMIANVDIRTGEKTVWEYLIKPFNKAQEALHER